MSAIIDEPLTLDVVFADAESGVDAEALERNHREVMSANLDATEVNAEAFAAFIDLLGVADTEYIDAADYVAPAPQLPLDWDAVSLALSESQQILIGVQNLLSETLAAMGVEDHLYIRVYADTENHLRLVSDHPRRAEIEAALNGPENAELRNLYHAAMSGMSLAGGLVGTMAVPEEVLEKVKAREYAA